MALETMEKLQASRSSNRIFGRLIERARQSAKPMRASDLLKSGLVGVWSKRRDIGDSVVFAQAQTFAPDSAGH